jgi:hypothetical protein
LRKIRYLPAPPGSLGADCTTSSSLSMYEALQSACTCCRTCRMPMPTYTYHIYIQVSAHTSLYSSMRRLNMQQSMYKALQSVCITQRLHTAAPAVCRGGTYVGQYEAARYAGVCGSYRSAAVHVRGVALRQHMLLPLP